MNLRDRGGEYLAKNLADFETAARVAEIREQMRLADSRSDTYASEHTVVADAIASAISESLATTDYRKVLADRGIITVALEDGKIVQHRPDGSVRDLDADTR